MAISEIRAVVKRFYGATAIVCLPDETEHRAETNSRNKSLVCGDEVVIEQRAGGYYVVDTKPRRAEFFRTDGFGRRKIIAANVDQIVLVVAPQPEPHFNIIDRYWVAARNCSIPMILVVSKSDIEATERLREIANLYPSLGLEICWVSAKNGDGLGDLKERLAKKVSVLVGQSGAGKSSLVNALCVNAEASVGELSSLKEEGKHTTTTTNFFALADGGRIMDSPGIREFGLSHYDQAELEAGFVEILEAAASCRFRNCAHQGTAGCAAEALAKTGEIDARRLQSYQTLLAQIS